MTFGVFKKSIISMIYKCKNCGKDFKLVTPGIRPEGADFGDQRRVMTPKQAIETGSDYLVIGRPITQAQDPLSVLKSINASIR